MVEPQTFAKNRVSEKSSVGRMRPTTWSTPGFCRPMAFSIPIGVSQTRCGGLPSRGSRVVPLSTIAPTCVLENPSTRVYSSPNPTQPESSTIGEASRRPQNSTASEGGRVAGPATGDMDPIVKEGGDDQWRDGGTATTWPDFSLR
jgi:hypothetical protein